MSSANLVVSTVSASLPPGITAGKFRFSVSGPVSATQDVDATSAIFDGLSAGDYSASCQRLDQNGSPFGPTASATFSVATFDAPSTLSVTLT